MADKKLTPMMELIEWMNTPADVIKDGLSVKQKANELLEKERQMVIDASMFAYERMAMEIAGIISEKDLKNMRQDSEQYYNETFKTNQL